MPFRLLGSIVLVLFAATSAPVEAGEPLEEALARAGENRPNLEKALASVSTEVRPHLEWLILGMGDTDLRTLDDAFLLEHAILAHHAWQEAPWREAIPMSIFREALLPYASVDERRDRWREDFRTRFLPLVAEARTAGEAATILNGAIFNSVGVKYSTQRPKANQSPYESIEAGLASCTGLSILLIDACRSVGVPARFVGTPLWSDGSGNHSWVEVWDGGQWRFTGAAEPTGKDLDRAWFTGRASKAHRNDPRNAIYATTWRRTPTVFPMVWSPEDRSVAAVDVTDRYTSGAKELPAGQVRVRFRVTESDDGARVALPFEVRDAEGAVTFAGTSRDEGFDANDHTTAVLPLGRSFHLYLATEPPVTAAFTVNKDEQLVELALPDHVTEPVAALRAHLDASPTERSFEGTPWARTPLTRTQAERARRMLTEDLSKRLRRDRQEEIETESITIGDQTLRYATKTFGSRPAKGWSLWISMHGGGGTTAEINDKQWENQKKLYTIEEGIYLAPRAPTNTWNLWHQGHIDGLFDRLIENFIHCEGIDPDRVFILGYSAGGDGVYQLAPRMADRLAGAAMMAGHPNDARPEGLRNLPFTLHMGGKDGAYSRNAVAREWKERLAKLRAADPAGYEHWVEIHEGKGHWMDREDAAALPWLARSTRSLRPEKVVWIQDDVTHPRFYWLAVDKPSRGARVEVSREGQTIEIESATDVEGLTIRLDDAMLDLDQPVVVRFDDRELFRGEVSRTIETIARTLFERGDPRGVWCAEIDVALSPAD